MNAPTLTLADAPMSASLAALDDPLEWDAFTQWLPAGQGVSTLQLSGLHCAACAGIIERELLAIDGVTAVQVNAAAQRASVTWQRERTAPARWVKALRRLGYDAAPDSAAPARALRLRESRQATWQLFVAAFCATQVMMFAAPAYFAAPGDLSLEMRRLLNWGSWVLSLPVVMFSARPYFSGALHALRTRRIGMDVPVALAIVITMLAGTAATFNPGGPLGEEVYFDSLTMFVALLLGGRWLEMHARQRSAVSLEAAMARLPDVALRREGAQWREVSPRRLRVGDELRVAVGQAFPADGRLSVGRTEVDEAMLTGESQAVSKMPGSEVVAGSINLGAPVEMVALRMGSDTRLQAIVAIMREAMSQRPDAARWADRWAAPFLWSVMLAAGAAALWHVAQGRPAQALAVAVAVLIVTCPCALSLAVPTTLLAAAQALARRGVIVQRLGALETLARATQVFFDKTGTLTQAQPQLRSVVMRDARRNEAQALQLAASLAQWSQHPLSRALASHGHEPLPLWREVQEQAGLGLSARDATGQRWQLGSAAWLGTTADATASVWLACEGQSVAGFHFEEGLREGAAQAVAAMQARGIKVSLLSGDEPTRAAAMASRLGITDVHASATPEMKLAVVAAAQAAGETVLMVGDGINDAPVLARADVSLAMGQGALLSRAQADAVIVSNQPLDLVDAHHIAQRAMHLVRQNLLWAALYNAACIPLALAGWLPPWLAALGMASSSLFVVLNAMRVERGVPRSS